MRFLRKRQLLFASVLVVLLWPVFAWIAARSLIVKSEPTTAHAIVVLSGSSTFIERTAWAARLYREGRAPLVVLTNDYLMSGWSAPDERNPFFYELAINELKRNGVPSNRIRVVPAPAVGTFRESIGIRDYAIQQQLHRLLIVTSAYHSRRAFWSLRRVSRDSNLQISIDSPPPGWQTPSSVSWWLRRTGWRLVAGEYVKLGYYWLKY